MECAGIQPKASGLPLTKNYNVNINTSGKSLSFNETHKSLYYLKTFSAKAYVRNQPGTDQRMKRILQTREQVRVHPLLALQQASRQVERLGERPAERLGQRARVRARELARRAARVRC